MTIIGGVVYKKSMIFKVFGVYLSEFLIFLHEIFFVSKILPSSCDKHQNFDFVCSCHPGNEAQSPDFGHFLTILGIFRALCLGPSLEIYLRISSFEPIINTKQTRFS